MKTLTLIFFFESSIICLALTLSSLLLRLSAILSYFVELALFKTKIILKMYVFHYVYRQFSQKIYLKGHF